VSLTRYHSLFVPLIIQLEQARGDKGNNMIIGEKRLKTSEDKILARAVVVDKTPDGKESLKITMKASGLGDKQVPRETQVTLLLRYD